MRQVAATAVDLVRRWELGQLDRQEEVQRARTLVAVFTRYGLTGLAPPALVGEVARLMEADDGFRRSVTAQLPAGRGNTISAGGPITATGGIIAGGDVSGSHNTDNRKKISFGGLLVAVVALGALLLVGKSVVGNLVTDVVDGAVDQATLTGSDTCRDFLAADPSTQIAVLKRVYLDAGKTERVGDPFILQNGQYECGQAPNMKLEDLARR